MIFDSEGVFFFFPFCSKKLNELLLVLDCFRAYSYTSILNLIQSKPYLCTMALIGCFLTIRAQNTHEKCADTSFFMLE